MSETNQNESDSDVTALTKRIAALEAENSRLRNIVYIVPAVGVLISIGMAVAVALGVGIVARLWPHRVVVAHRILLMDQDRHVRANLSVDNRGTAGLTIEDANRQHRLTLAVAKSGVPYLSMHGADGKTSAYLTVYRDKTPALVMRDSKDVPRLELKLRNDHPALFLQDSGGAQRASLTIGRNEAPAFWLDDRSGVARAVLLLEDGTEPSLELLGHKGKGGPATQVTLDGSGLSVSKQKPTAKSPSSKQKDRLRQPK